MPRANSFVSNVEDDFREAVAIQIADRGSVGDKDAIGRLAEVGALPKDGGIQRAADGCKAAGLAAVPLIVGLIGLRNDVCRVGLGVNDIAGKKQSATERDVHVGAGASSQASDVRAAQLLIRGVKSAVAIAIFKDADGKAVAGEEPELSSVTPSVPETASVCESVSTAAGFKALTVRSIVDWAQKKGTRRRERGR